MPTRDPANEPMAFSFLANREVSTWSEEWKHECEVALLLDITPEKRRVGEGDGSKGIKHHRGEKATAELASEVDRLKALRSAANERGPASRN